MTTEKLIMDPAPPSAPAPVLTGPKRQHFLPRFFLQGFVGDDGCLAVYDREKREVRRQQPVNTGAVGHLYTMTDDQGRQRFELEKALSEIEASAANHFPALLEGGAISLEARGAIAHFIGTLATRTPEFIESIRHLNGQMIKATTGLLFSTEAQAYEALRSSEKHSSLSDAEVEVLAKDMVDFAARGEYEVDTHHEWAVSMALPLGETVAEILAQRHWSLWRAPPRAAFVVSDAPVVLTTLVPRKDTFMGIGFGSSDALVLVPLNSSCALAMFGDGRKNDVLQVNSGIARRLNIDVASRSQRFVIARDNALVEAIARASGLEKSKWKPKFGMNVEPG